LILAIDIGNTNLVLGAFEEDKLKFVARISSDTNRTEDEMAVIIKSVLENHGAYSSDISGTIISSVVPSLTQTSSKAIKLLTGEYPFVVEPGIRTGINILIDNPAQLGSDLLVDSVAAANLYPKPVIIVDMGTATTFSVVDEDNCMIGGAIMPGVRISVNALSERTAQLPHINIEAPKKAIGTNTIDCMRSGVVFGAAAMIDGMIDRFEEELGKECFVVATGGLAEEVCKHTKRKIEYNKNLILEGLFILYHKNLKNFKSKK
jgi:type III pantothenate kinase